MGRIQSRDLSVSMNPGITGSSRICFSMEFPILSESSGSTQSQTQQFHVGYQNTWTRWLNNYLMVLSPSKFNEQLQVRCGLWVTALPEAGFQCIQYRLPVHDALTQRASPWLQWLRSSSADTDEAERESESEPLAISLSPFPTGQQGQMQALSTGSAWLCDPPDENPWAEAVEFHNESEACSER